MDLQKSAVNFTPEFVSLSKSISSNSLISIEYTYDRFGNKSTVTHPDTDALTYNYDDLNRLTSVVCGPLSVVSYTYDSASRMTTKTLENGTVSTYGYDSVNRLTSITNPNMSYTYDNVGNRLTKTNTYGVHTHGYDSTYRLLTADNPDTIGDEIYSYDSVGNRLTNEDYADWTYNAGNQLTNYNSTIFTFDNNGNTTTKVNTEGTTTYAWDTENRLLSAVTPSKTVAFYFDSFGKRLSKTVGGTAIWYFYDNEDIVAEYDSSGTLLRSYVHGQGIDEPTKMTNHITGINYYYLIDGLGSITEIQDNVGTTVEKYSYDSFGNVTLKDNTDVIIARSAIGNFYAFTGREYDREIGLYYYRARYYDPVTGRFISEDQLTKYLNLFYEMLEKPQQLNPYVYCNDNPIVYKDPQGNSSIPVEPDWVADRVYNYIEKKAQEVVKSIGICFNIKTDVATNWKRTGKFELFKSSFDDTREENQTFVVYEYYSIRKDVKTCKCYASAWHNLPARGGGWKIVVDIESTSKKCEIPCGLAGL